MRRKFFFRILAVGMLIVLSACGMQDAVEMTTQSRTYEPENRFTEMTETESSLDSEAFASASLDTTETRPDEIAIDVIPPDVTKLWARRVFSERELEWIRENIGVPASIYASGKRIEDGIRDIYPDTDFSKASLNLNDSFGTGDQLTGILSLTSKLQDDSVFIYDAESVMDITETAEIELTVHSSKRVDNSELTEYFVESGQVTEVRQMMEDRGYPLRGMLAVEVTIRNRSDRTFDYYLNDIALMEKMGELGRYSVMNPKTEMVDFDYTGEDRHLGKSRNAVSLQPEEEYRMTLLYIIVDDTFGVATDEFYLHVGGFSEPLFTYESDRLWHANSSGNDGYVRLKVE